MSPSTDNTTTSNPFTPRIPIPDLPIPPADLPLFKSLATFVHTYMSAPGHDASHDYSHILRVLSNTNKIFQVERATNPAVSYNVTVLFLTALLHDVGDHKYLAPGENAERQVRDVLIQHGATPELAETVQLLTTHVSYTYSLRHPTRTASLLQSHPELAIIQDADRLDALGAVGIARCFAFGAARYPEQPLERAIAHFEEKLERLAGGMRTEEGKRLGLRRGELVGVFRREFVEEGRLGFGFLEQEKEGTVMSTD